MARCSAITKAGERCRLDAIPGAEWCYSHDPDRREERRQNARRAGRAGGRGRPGSGELVQIKREIRSVIGGVLTGHITRPVGAVAFQGFNALLKAIETERRIKETEELEERIEALEDEQRVGGWRSA
jgi:hypothetical protein